MEEETQMGKPRSTTRQMEKILKYVEIGKEGTKRCFAAVYKRKGELEKRLLPPSNLIRNVTNDMRVAQEDLLDQLHASSSLKQEEVLAMANDSAYGRRCCLDQRYQQGPSCGKEAWKQDVCGSTPTMRSRKALHLAAARHPVSEEETHKVILEHYTQMKNIMINMAAPTGFLSGIGCKKK